MKRTFNYIVPATGIPVAFGLDADRRPMMPKQVLSARCNAAIARLLFVLIVYTLVYQSAFRVLGLPMEWRGLIVHPLIGAAAVLYCLVAGRRRIIFPVEVMLFGAWLLWCLLGAGDELLDIAGEGFWLQYRNAISVGVIFFLSAGICCAIGSIRTTMIAFAVGGVCVLILGIYSGEWTAARAAAGERLGTLTTGNSNEYAYYLLLGIVGTVYLLKNRAARVGKSLLVILILMLAAGIVLSASRKAFVVMILFVSLEVWSHFRKKRFGACRAILFGTIVMCFLWVGWEAFFHNSLIKQRFDETGYSWADVRHAEWHRIGRYAKTIDIIKRHPAVGLGLGNFPTESEMPGAAHSEYIGIATETGLVGALLYFGIYVILWMRLRAAQKQVAPVAILSAIDTLKAAVICILVISLGRWNYTSFVTYVLIGSAVGLVIRFGKHPQFPNLRRRQSIASPAAMRCSFRQRRPVPLGNRPDYKDPLRAI